VTHWVSKGLFWLRSTASYLALVGVFLALGWLAYRLESVPPLKILPWDREGAPLVVVDAGHGAHDGGAVANGVVEKDLSLTLAKQVRERLEKAGVRVQMTREKDRFLELEERCQVAADCGADAFVSIHLNTSPSAEVHGLETYYAAKSLMNRAERSGSKEAAKATGAHLAEILQRRAIAATQAEDRGIKDSQLIVVMRSPCPAALVECGFLTHSDEARCLKSSDYQQKLTQGIADGMIEFLRTWKVFPLSSESK
jgi:N-acetylmuramoyl-L-alanine amidase